MSIILTEEQKLEAQKKEQEEFDAQAKAYLEEITKLSKERGLSFKAALSITPQGIVPIVQVVKLETK